MNVFDFGTKRVRLPSGFSMPIIGLGTYALSSAEVAVSVAAHTAAGGRLIDTAYMYRNEAAVGRAVRRAVEAGVPREELFVITKLYPSQFDHAETAIREALERIGLDYLDMMLLHRPGRDDVAAYRAMEAFVRVGRIRSLGLSNWYVRELTDFLPKVSVKPSLVQNEIHPYYQDTEVVRFIQAQSIVVQAWYPLGGRGHTRAMFGDETLKRIAAAHGVTVPQVILRCHLQRGGVAVPGSANPEHVRENLDLFGFALTEADMAAIAGLNRDEKHDWY